MTRLYHPSLTFDLWLVRFWWRRALTILKLEQPTNTKHRCAKPQGSLKVTLTRWVEWIQPLAEFEDTFPNFPAFGWRWILCFFAPFQFRIKWVHPLRIMVINPFPYIVGMIRPVRLIVSADPSIERARRCGSPSGIRCFCGHRIFHKNSHKSFDHNGVREGFFKSFLHQLYHFKILTCWNFKAFLLVAKMAQNEWF